MKNIVTGLLAGIIAFVWITFSWMALPWHKTTIQQFNGGPLIAKSIGLAAPKSGIYVYPAMQNAKPGEGPLIFAAVYLPGMKNMGACMGIGILIYVLAGIILTHLVAKAKAADFSTKFILVLKAALFTGVICFLSNWNWWGFPVNYTFVAFADLLISWVLAGILIAKRT